MGCGVITQIAEAKLKPGVNILEDVSMNFRGAGVCAKVIPLKAGMRVLQHKHDYDHLSLLMSGTVTVETDDGKVPLIAPASMTIKANTYHRVHAITDATWVCIHDEAYET